jgi:hypothetical protein
LALVSFVAQVLLHYIESSNEEDAVATLYCWALLRQLGHVPDAAHADTVMGVVFEQGGLLGTDMFALYRGTVTRAVFAMCNLLISLCLQYTVVLPYLHMRVCPFLRNSDRRAYASIYGGRVPVADFVACYPDYTSGEEQRVQYVSTCFIFYFFLLFFQLLDVLPQFYHFCFGLGVLQQSPDAKMI